MSEIKNKMQELITYLNMRTAEYEMGEPTISDEEWDEKYFELQELEKEYPNEILDTSPTQQIYFTKIDKLEKVQHNHLMLSLDKTKDTEAVQNFAEKYENAIFMTKLDGLTISLTYIDGILMKAETRGNGVMGEDITHNALVIQNIPKHIPYADTVVIDGEIICKWDDFEQMSSEYKHPRNYAAGSLRLLDSDVCKDRRLFFVAWDCIEGIELENLDEKLSELSMIGFDISPYIVFHSSEATNVDILIEELKSQATLKNYPIDGIVIKNNNCEEYNEEGNTQHHPKGALAFKFYDEVYPTRLLGIEWSISRTNIITPIALFESVDIDSTSVQRASLHNYGIAMKLFNNKPYVGQKLYITKRNMIIPNVEDAEWNEDEYNNSTPIEIIHKCPKCNGELKEEVVEGRAAIGSILRCINPNCNGANALSICHYASKNGMDIMGLSKATIQKLIDYGWVSNIIDLYSLRQYKDGWINKPGWGVVSVEKILKSIEASKKKEMYKFLCALGIPQIGEKYAIEICKKFETYEQFRNAVDSKYDFTKLKDIGIEKSNSILTFDYAEADKLYAHYLQLVNGKFSNNVAGNKGSLHGLSFCITGKLNNFKNREELQAFIEQNGGTFNKSLVKSVKYLINNDLSSRTDKNVKARERGIEVITEEQFLELVNNNE